MNQFDRLIAAAAKKARKTGLSAGLPATPRTIREESSQESSRQWHPLGWGILFCVHNRSYFDVCPHCKRTKKLAQLEFEGFCKRRGISL